MPSLFRYVAEVKFTLEVLRETLLRALHAYGQAMSAIRNLTEDALDDLIPSFLLTGQQTPALAAGFLMS
jgi:hypothetical protein